jgi:hypothetical protein
VFPSHPKESCYSESKHPSLSPAFHSSAHTLEDGEGTHSETGGTYCCFYLISSFVGYFFFVYLIYFVVLLKELYICLAPHQIFWDIASPPWKHPFGPTFTMYIHESSIMAKAYGKKIEALIGNDLGNNLGT